MPSVRLPLTGVLLILVLHSGVLLAQGCLEIGPAVVSFPPEVSRDVTVDLTKADIPVTDIELSVIEKNTGNVVRQVTTDPQGRAEIRGLLQGEYTIVSPVSEDYEIRATGKEGSTKLHLPAIIRTPPVVLSRIHGVVVDPSGSVLANAVAVVEFLDESHTPVAVGTSDEAGHLVLRAKPGFYLMRVAEGAFVTAVVPIRVARNGWNGFRLTMNVGGCPLLGPRYKIAPDEQTPNISDR